MSNLLKTPATLLLLAVLSAPLAACNTIAGAGEDVEAAGDAVERSAERNKHY